MPSSALAPTCHPETSMSASNPMKRASAASLPKAPSATLPSRVSRSPSQPARSPSPEPDGRQENSAPEAGVSPYIPSVVNAVADMPFEAV